MEDSTFYHPEDPSTGLYYIEYSPELNTWRLFKRNILPEQITHPILGGEGHPYQLANGPIQSNVIGLNNPKFLNFMVEAMNDFSRRD